MSQSVLWMVMIALQGVTVIGVVGAFFRVGKWIGKVENQLSQNTKDHGRFDKDLRHAHERIDSLPTR